MTKLDEQRTLEARVALRQGVTRRDFLTSMGVLGATLAGSAVVGCSPTETVAAAVEDPKEAEPVAEEVETTAEEVVRTNPYDDAPSPNAEDTSSSLGESAFVEKQYFPEQAAPEVTEYTCDVLVVGCGWAGLHAATTAANAGASVVVVDKGRPGYSGLSPFSQGATYHIEGYDDREASVTAMMMSGEYVANLDWFNVWLDESEEAVEQNRSFGLMETYPSATEAGYWDKWDPKGYRKEFEDKMRQPKWMGILADHNITVVEHTMLVDLITDETGAVCGGVGLHVKSATPITFNCKAVCMCTGTGSMKPTGYPTSSDTFDGEYICTNLGLTFVGKEFDDFHQTASYAPGSYFYDNTWEYSENMNGASVGATMEGMNEYVVKKLNSKIVYRNTSVLNGLAPVDGHQWQSAFTAASLTGHDGGASDPRDIGFTRSKERVRDIFGAAPGMNSQMSCGVYCGWDDTVGQTAVPGLYVAGNGIYGCMVNGAVFAVQTNHPGCCVMGNRSGAAAAEYAAGASLQPLDQAKVDAVVEEIFTPTQREKGVDPNWIIERLRDILVNPGVHIIKSEKALTAALMQIELIRDNYLPMMMGYTGHDLRLCLEAKHKCRSAEMKVKANLFRTESRGLHYRSDFPFRDDENWLCHVGVYLDENGEVACRKIDIPDSWKGDTSKAHEERYLVLFPGEAKKLGIETEKSGR